MALTVPCAAQAATLPVSSCADAGPGTLRAAVAAAGSGDTVDLRALACRRILLTSGPIAIPQARLAIRGPGFARLAVSGNWASSVFRHSGTGTLALRGIAIERGAHRAEAAYGGCVYSSGHVHATDVQVRHCGAYARTIALGGGIYARGNVTLQYSALLSNGVRGASTAGGAVASGEAAPAAFGGHVRAHRTRFVDNEAGQGGAIRALDGLELTYSTVADNRARRFAGGLDIGSLQGTPTRIAFSTISGNSAVEQTGAFAIGGAVSIENSTISANAAPFISVGTLSSDDSIVNSTVAFNRTTTPFDCVGAIVVSGSLHVDSSILARNTCNGAPAWDVHNGGGSQPTAILGGGNLIETPGVDALPADTLTGVDPQLGPLADNGGRTRTHLPDAGSPALDRGHNAAGFAHDQRGDGFPRVTGAGVDIGAVER